MDPPPRPPSMFPDAAEPSILPKALLAVGAGAVGGAAGGWGMSLLAGTLFYIPLIPGALAGYAVQKACDSGKVLICAIAGFFGFAGMVFGDALTFELIGYPGAWNYITHFWVAATPSKVLFWILNVAVGYWFARVVPVGQYAPYSSDLPAATRQVPCPHCSRGNLPGAKFCSHCGEQMR